MWTDVLRTVLVIVHVGVTAVWLGATLYSLVVVQPKLGEFFADANPASMPYGCSVGSLS